MPYTASLSRAQKPRSGLALGSVGCGWFELRHDGVFRNWNIANNRPVGRGAHFAVPDQSVLFFVLRVEVEGEEPTLRVPQIEESHEVAGMEEHEFRYIFPWLDGVDRIDYAASVPFARLRYTFDYLPVELDREAWSPLVPRNARDSALPVAFFDFTARATGEKPVRVSLVASARNIAGYDLPLRKKLWAERALRGADHAGGEFGLEGGDTGHSLHGTIALVSDGADSRVWLGRGHPHLYDERLLRERELPEADDMAGRNGRDSAEGPLYAKYPCYLSAGHPADLRQGGAAEPEERPHVEGHFYRTFLHGATEVAAYARRERARLERETRAFHDARRATSLPEWLQDLLNAQLNTLRTSTWFTLAGDFGVLEGLSPTQSFAGLATVDVAMYEQPLISALFPEIGSRDDPRACAFADGERDHLSLHRAEFSAPRSARSGGQARGPAGAVSGAGAALRLLGGRRGAAARVLAGGAARPRLRAARAGPRWRRTAGHGGHHVLLRQLSHVWRGAIRGYARAGGAARVVSATRRRRSATRRCWPAACASSRPRPGRGSIIASRRAETRRSARAA